MLQDQGIEPKTSTGGAEKYRIVVKIEYGAATGRVTATE